LPQASKEHLPVPIDVDKEHARSSHHWLGIHFMEMDPKTKELKQASWR